MSQNVWDNANWGNVRLEGLPPEALERIDQLCNVAATHHRWVLIRDAFQFYEEHLRAQFPAACAQHIKEE